MQSAKSSAPLELDHGPALMSLAARLAGASQDAEDLVQATYLRALESGHRVEHKRSWLRRVLINERNMGLRGSIRRSDRELRHSAPEENLGMEHLLHCLEIARVVQQLVDELDEDVALVVRERYFDGHTAAQIARDHEIPAGTVRWRLKNGLNELRERLDLHYGGRRALWAGALVPSGLVPTLGGGTASKGLSAGNTTVPAAKGSPLMSFKILATTIALVAAGTGVVLLADSDPSTETAQSADVRAASPPTETAPKTAKGDSATKRIWAERLAKIRSARSSALSTRPSAADVPKDGIEEADRTVLTLCGDEPCAPDALDDALAGCDDVHCLAKLVGEVSRLLDTCRPLLADAPADLLITAEVIGAPDVGTVVESVELSTEYEASEDLSECLTEATYALDLGTHDAPFQETVTVAVAGDGPGENAALKDVDPETLKVLERTLAGLAAESEGEVGTARAGADISRALGELELHIEAQEAHEAAAGEDSEARVLKLPDSGE